MKKELIGAALDDVAVDIEKADADFQEADHRQDEWAYENSQWRMTLAFQKLLVIAEALQLPWLRADIRADFEVALKKPFESERSPDDEYYLKWAGILRRYRSALHTAYGVEASRTITKDIESIVRSATYSITDVKAFGGPPDSEDAVHRRLEAILRCVFPDLLHKPRLAKAIKNFEPDTGIPSIKTLIEYKYLDGEGQAAAVADQILADTRGYASKEWDHFIYAIYETRRFRSEHQWNQLLRESEVSENSSVVVLTGDMPGATRRSRKGRRSKKI